MTLKALLLGSAAAMIAVSGAKAADIAVAEPEAVDYVKVCDMYGAGFFYIPGTETCLKIHGYVRVNYSYDDRDQDPTRNAASSQFVVVGPTATGAAGTRPTTPTGGNVFTVDVLTDNTRSYLVTSPASVTAGASSTSSWDYRGQVNFDARNETDYGTLRSQLRLQGDGDGATDGNVGIDRALISLGGLRVGYSDSFWATNGGYGLPVAINDGYFGFDQSIFIDYTFAANGFSFTAGVEDPNGGDAGASNPNFYAGGAYSGSWGEIAATVAYDNAVNDTAWIVKASFNVFDGFTLKGFYAGDGGDDTSYVQGIGDWAYGVGVSYAATDALDLYAGYGDRDQGDSTAFNPNDDQWYVNVGANYDITTGLRIQGEVNIYDDGQAYTVRLHRDF